MRSTGLRRWFSFWFTPAPLLDLAIARIVLALIVLELNGTMRFLPVGLVPPELWKPLPWIEALGFTERPSVPELVVYGRLTKIAAIAAGLGLCTNVSLAVLFVLQLVQEGFLNCFGKMNHATIPLLYAILCFALAPSGRAISLDALLRRARHRRRGGPAPVVGERWSPYARWPFELIFLELALYYFLAGTAKIWASGPAWADGYTLQYYLLEKATPAGLWLAEHPLLCAVLSAGVLVFELSWPFGVVWRRLRPWLFAAGLAFHVGTIVFLRISFWPVWILYALFVPWSSLAARVRALAGILRPQVADAGPRQPA